MKITNTEKTPLRYIFTKQDETRATVSLVELIILPDLFGRNPCGYIHKVYTDELHQGRGHASELMEKAIEKARENGCYKLFLICQPDITPFYEKLGLQAKQVEMEIRL